MALQQVPNYEINIPDASKAFEEGMMWRQQYNQQQAARAEGEEIKKAIASLGPNPSVQSINALIVKYPALAERFKKPLEILSDEERQTKQGQAIPIYAAMQNGKPEIAISLLQQQADALRNSGNEKGARDAEAQINLIKADPNTATTAFGVTLGFIMGPDAFEKTFKSLDAQRSAPVELREKSAAATLKELEAKYAPEKIAADLGLVGAQAEQARAAAGASRAAARKSDAEASGVNSALIPPEKRPQIEADMRKEYLLSTKSYQEVKDAYGRVLSSQATPAGDMALIFNYMKMLDPGSGVKEGEYATAAQAAGIPTRIVMLYNKAVAGRGLDDKTQRQDFINQAKILYEQASSKEKTVRTGMTRIATGYGLSPTNIFYEAVETAPTAPGAAAPPPAAVAPPPSAATAGGVGSQVAGGVAALAAAELARRRGGG